MTAGEAAGLAIAAGGLARPEVVFWLDCGRPVRIVDLALRLARAYGVDPRIEIVGLRPGERLHELLCREDDDVATTAFPHVMCSPVERVDPEWLQRVSLRSLGMSGGLPRPACARCSPSSTRRRPSR